MIAEAYLVALLLCGETMPGTRSLPERTMIVATVANRAESCGTSISTEIKRKGQFSPFSPGHKIHFGKENLERSTQCMEDAELILEWLEWVKLWPGTYFHASWMNPPPVQSRKGKNHVQVGDHTFYALEDSTYCGIDTWKYLDIDKKPSNSSWNFHKNVQGDVPILRPVKKKEKCGEKCKDADLRLAVSALRVKIKVDSLRQELRRRYFIAN